MGRDPASVASLKAYSRLDALGDEMVGSIAEVRGQNDRAMVIIMVAHVEAALTDCLRVQLRTDLTAAEDTTLFENEGPLATLAAKIQMGRAMGLYGPKTREDLDLLRVYRNTCAHAKRVASFKLDVFQAPLDRFHVLEGHVETVFEGGNTSRNRFLRVCIIYSVRLGDLSTGDMPDDQRPELLP